MNKIAKAQEEMYENIKIVLKTSGTSSYPTHDEIKRETIKEFRKELVKLYPAFPNKQTLANIKFWKVLMDKAEETLTQQSLDGGE